MKKFAHFVVVAAAVAFTSAAAADYDLPTIGQPADRIMSPAEEQRLGGQVISQLLANGLILEDPQLTDYIRSVGRRLARHTKYSAADFHFYVIDNPAVNAFALPGGYIGVNAGLILESENESELAGVLAHEIAHVTQRHIARQIEKTQGVNLATAAAMLLVAIAGGGDPDVVQAAITMGMANMGQQRINFTRAHELEADRLGIRTLAAAGYNADGMASFFQKMERRSRLYGNRLPEILLTHPLSTTRISEARARGRDYQAQSVHENPHYPLMRARARALASTQPSDVVQYFRDKRQAGDDSDASAYGHALALMRVGRVPAALEILQDLNAHSDGQPHYALALAEAQAARGRLEDALDTLEAVRAQHPSYRPLVLAHANMLVETGRPGAARSHLLDRTELLGSDAETHMLLARASDRLGRAGEAYYQQAEGHRLRGQYAAAIHKLRSALALPELSSLDEARIRAALAQHRAECNRAWSERECRKRIDR